MADEFRLALACVLVEGMGEHPGFVESGSTPALAAFLLRDLFLDRLGVSLHKFLGAGSRSIVFGGRLGDRAVAVKLVSTHHCCADGRAHQPDRPPRTHVRLQVSLVSELDEDFLRDVRLHRHACAVLPGWTPCLHHAEIVVHRSRTLGVVVMERMSGQLQDLHLVEDEDPSDLAQQVAILLATLQRKRFVHGNLQLEKLAFTKVTHDGWARSGARSLGFSADRLCRLPHAGGQEARPDQDAGLCSGGVLRRPRRPGRLRGVGGVARASVLERRAACGGRPAQPSHEAVVRQRPACARPAPRHGVLGPLHRRHGSGAARGRRGRLQLQEEQRRRQAIEQALPGGALAPAAAVVADRSVTRAYSKPVGALPSMS